MTNTFVEPVQSWGEDPFGDPSAVVLQLLIKPGSDRYLPLQFWDVVVDLVKPHSTKAGVSELFVLVNSNGPRKQIQGKEPLEIQAQSLHDWWQADPQGVSARAPDQPWDLSVFAMGAPTGAITIDVSIDHPDDLHIEAFCSALGELSNLTSELTGHVGVGKTWLRGGTFATHKSVRGYGPAVTALSNDTDLSSLDSELVEPRNLDGDRTFLRIRPGVDLVNGTKEIRKACWPGLGLQFAQTGTDSGTLSFEGVPGLFDWGDRLLQHLGVHQTSTVERNALTAPATRSIVIADGQPIDATVWSHLSSLIEAWRRVATSMLPIGQLREPGLIACAMERGDASMLIRHDPAPIDAIEALYAVLDKEWTPLFRLPKLDLTGWS